MTWIRVMEYVTIGPGVVPPDWSALAGYSMDEVGPSLKRLIARGLIIEPKPGFYALPGWSRPRTDLEFEAQAARIDANIRQLLKPD